MSEFKIARPGLIVFDMDGVLVNVHASYRETIRATVQHFTGLEVEHSFVQEYKNRGGFNNDWKLSQQICSDLGHTVEYSDVVEIFQRLFLGDDRTPGLIQKEIWLPTPGTLEALAKQSKLAVFTGRLQFEANLTLDRFQATHLFLPVVGEDNVTKPKPDPEGLLSAIAAHGNPSTIYLGDTLDDACAAKAANVPFVGIVSLTLEGRSTVVESLTANGAIAILPDINHLAGIFQ
jgi:HAD superfamily phosphatase